MSAGGVLSKVKWCENEMSGCDDRREFILLSQVLVCTTDPHPKVRQVALDLLAELGRYHMLDHEDLSIVTTLSTRHISLKVHWSIMVSRMHPFPFEHESRKMFLVKEKWYSIPSFSQELHAGWPLLLVIY